MSEVTETVEEVVEATEPREAKAPKSVAKSSIRGAARYYPSDEKRTKGSRQSASEPRKQ